MIRIPGRSVGLAVLALLAASLSTTAPAGGATAPEPATRVTAEAGVPSDVRLLRVRHSLLGSHAWYQQVHHGVPVQGGYYAVHDYGHALVRVDDGRRPVNEPVQDSRQDVIGHSVVARATTGVPGASVRRQLVVLAGSGRLTWRVDTDSGRQAFVDAATGELVRVVSVVRHAEGRGRVFDPNPVAALNRQDIRDRGDADTPVLQSAYRTVTLRRMDGSRELRGEWARVTRAKGGLARSGTRRFVYQRSDDRFEQVSAYHGVDSAQAYLQHLGFRGIMGVNAHSQVINVNLFPDDNSYYDPNTDRISFGTGGVDDAEDLDVVWHEYGHAMQDDQVPGFGTSNQARALGEGFGDYVAMAMSQRSDALRGQARTSPPYGCIADWDATSYTRAPHCLRRTKLNLTMSDYDRSDIHWSGQIWSRALHDINTQLGADDATRLIVEAQFAFAPGTSFEAAAQRTVETAKLLFAKQPAVAEGVRQAFVRREIL